MSKKVKVLGGIIVVALGVGLWCLVFCGPGEIGESLETIANNYAVVLLTPPRADVKLGSTIRERDHHILTSGCFVGEIRTRRLLDLPEATVDVSRSGSLGAQIAEGLGLKMDASRATKAVLRFGKFWEEALENVRPRFGDDCPHGQDLAEHPVIGALLRVDQIEVDFSGDSTAKAAGSAEELKDLGIGEIEGNFEFVEAGRLRFTGGKLYLGYKPLKPSYSRETDTEEYLSGQEPQRSQNLQYRLFLGNVVVENGRTLADFRVTNDRLGESIYEKDLAGLGEGDHAELYKVGNQLDTVQVLSVSRQSVRVEFVRRRYNVERGPVIAPAGDRTGG